MLVLSRRKGQVVMIGKGADVILLKVIDVCGDKVRLGLEARSDIPIHRKEVWDAIQQEQSTTDVVDP